MKTRIGRISLTVLLTIASVLLAVNLVVRPSNATPVGQQNISTAVAAVQTTVDILELLNADELALLGVGPGDVFYVDKDASGSGDAASWTNADITVELALVHCTASAGDTIVVRASHTETFTSEDLDLDKIGVNVIGLGRGSLRPTIIFNNANAEVAIGADNVMIKNFRFISSVTGVLMGIEVENGVDFFRIENCEFTSAGDAVGTDEFVEAINFVNNNIGCEIINNSFNAEAAGAAHAIFCDADTNRLSIIGNDIRGDYSVACIGGDTAASTDMLIKDNILINGSLVGDAGINAAAAISMLEATGGLVTRNIIVSDVITGLLMRIADDMVFVDNWVTDRDGDEFGGATETTSASITIFVDGG